MLALLVGSVLAIAGLAYVLLPLLRPDLAPVSEGAIGGTEVEPTAIDALREIEFDQATGKLSPEDYNALRAEYTPLAMAELEASDRANALARGDTGPGGGDDLAERLIARAKSRATSCPSCGPRPEPDALYCSDCGRNLAASCLKCGATVENPQARFCGECGAAIAA